MKIKGFAGFLSVTNYINGEDLLSFTNTGNIVGDFNTASGILTLTGSDTVANYQAALRSVAYQNTSEDPNTVERFISFTVNDGIKDSNVLTSTVSVVAVNDAAAFGGDEERVSTAID